MTRDQIIAHLSLLGWVPIVSREGDYGPERNRVGSELRLLNPALRHNIPGGAVRLPPQQVTVLFPRLG